MTTDADARPDFTLQSPTPTGDILGMWSAAPAAPAEVSFDAQAATVDAPVWRVNLPVDAAAASTILTSGRAQVRAAQHALNDAADRLQAFVDSQLGAPSFDIPLQASRLDRPEVETLALLNEIRSGVPAVSFGLADKIDAGLDKVAGEFRDFVDGLVRQLAHYAWVETHIEGRLVCRTAIGWSGDAVNLFQTETDHDILALHQQSLNLAIESRGALIKSLGLVAQGAAKLAALLSVPGGAVLALPAAWKFINRVLAELRPPATPSSHPQEV